MPGAGNKVTIDGLAPLVKRLRALDKGLVVEVKALNRAAAERVATRARSLAPFDTGTLAGTIKPGGTVRSGYVQVGSARVPYAQPIHFGWPAHNIEAQPFLWDALDEEQDTVTREYARGLDALIARVF